jgi:hypothetical protein
VQTKPVESVKKVTTPSEASYIIKNVIGKDTYQCSGTAIDEHKLVTCWHLLRNGTGTLTVNGMPAKVLKVDSKSDVALLATVDSLKHVPVANEPLKAGEACTAYGYEYSRKGLFKFPSRITGINRYRGFPNVSILGRPQSGRSGGGLFNANGELVGVCSAADGNEGLYCGLDAIHALIKQPSNKQVVKPQVITPQTMPDFGVQSNKNCPDGTCPLIPKQAPAIRKNANVSSVPTVSPRGACPTGTCPSARQNSPTTAVPSFPPYSRTRGIFFRGRR